MYSGIQTKLVGALGDDNERIDVAFRSFIATVESHDSETAMALQRGAGEGRERDTAQSPFEDVDNLLSNEERVFKKPKVDESAFVWSLVRNRKFRNNNPITQLTQNAQIPTLVEKPGEKIPSEKHQE